LCNRDETQILIQSKEFLRNWQCRSTGFYQSKECVQVKGSVHLKTYWCFTQTDRQTDRPPAHQPTTTLQVHPLMATHHCSFRIFTAPQHILPSQPQVK